MTKEQCLLLMDKRFKESFPNSHLLIGYDMSSHKSGTTHQWTLDIRFNELEDEDLNPDHIFEQYEGDKGFKELMRRVEWHSYRYQAAVNGIREEIEMEGK